MRYTVVLVHYQDPHKLAVEMEVVRLMTVLVLAGLGLTENVFLSRATRTQCVMLESEGAT